MIIQTILLAPSRAVWIDEAPNVSRLDPSGAVQVDAEHPSRNRKVEGCSDGQPTTQRHHVNGDGGDAGWAYGLMLWLRWNRLPGS
jgi:hypothetical protein